MAPDEKLQSENSPSSPGSASRRSFVKGLGAAGVALPALAMLPRWGFAEDVTASYANAAIDWKQFAGQTIALAGAIHPWSNAITPLLWDFTKLTGISVVTDFRLETTYLGALPIQLNRGGSTPDVFMYTTYGQGISNGWLEPLNAYYSDRSLTDPGWYDESDLLKTARAFPLWQDGERYAIPITSEAVTLFINGDALAARNLPVPQTFDELLVTANAVKTNEMSGIAMRAQASGNSSVPAMSFVFSYGGAHGQGQQGRFREPRGHRGHRDVRSTAQSGRISRCERLRMVPCAGRLPSAQDGDGDRQQQLRYRHLQSGEKPGCQPGRVCRLSASRRSHVRALHVALAGVHQFQVTKQAGGFPVSAVGDKQADLAADRRSGAGDDTRVGLVERGLQEGVRRTSRGGGTDQFAECRCRPRQGDPFPSAIETDPGRLHDRRE